uniref:Uncharacterized protein n=1 Tax=Phakopsora pachyrhizi TaxID=170000 RepID=A0A0S1MKC9_PHAPC
MDMLRIWHSPDACRIPVPQDFILIFWEPFLDETGSMTTNPSHRLFSFLSVHSLFLCLMSPESIILMKPLGPSEMIDSYFRYSIVAKQVTALYVVL